MKRIPKACKPDESVSPRGSCMKRIPEPSNPNEIWCGGLREVQVCPTQEFLDQRSTGSEYRPATGWRQHSNKKNEHDDQLVRIAKEHDEQIEVQSRRAKWSTKRSTITAE